jgi:hypothetical protein
VEKEIKRPCAIVVARRDDPIRLSNLCAELAKENGFIAEIVLCDDLPARIARGSAPNVVIFPYYSFGTNNADDYFAIIPQSVGILILVDKSTEKQVSNVKDDRVIRTLQKPFNNKVFAIELLIALRNRPLMLKCLNR